MTWGTISGGPINLFTWNSLYPYNYSSSFGGQYQFNVMPMTLSPQQAFDIQNVFNPFYQFSKMMNAVTASFNPFQNMQQMMLSQAAYNQGWQIGESIGINTQGRNIASNIASLKSQLESAISSDKLTKEQKDELRALKREVEALEDRLADVEHLRQSGATNEQLKTALQEINSDYRELRDKIQEAAERIQEEVSESDESDEAEESDETEEPEGQGDKEETDSTEVSSKIGQLNTVSFNENMVSADIDDDNVRKIVNTIYQKVDGAGSGNIQSYLNDNVNKDNVVEILLHWNKQYADLYSEDDPLGLTETLMDERSIGGYKLCTKILESLEQRLQDYQGVNAEMYSTASTQLAIARREHDAAFSTNEDKMSEAINKAHKCIVILMAEKAEQDKK